MMRRVAHALPKRTVEALRDAQDRQTIRMALSNGATVTPIGAISHLRLPGQDRTQQFPSALVEDVRRGMGGSPEGEEGTAHLTAEGP